MRRQYACLLLLFLWCCSTTAAQRRTRNIILITADGLRWQEVFTGIDPLLMNEETAGMKDAGSVREKLWRASAEERRKVLMPFFWTQLAPRGVVLGNVQRNSSVRVTNAYRVSYPGYSEILTGRAQDQVIRGNKPIQNPTPSVLEFLRNRLGLSRSDVAIFASWAPFHAIGESKPGSIVVNAGYRELGAGFGTARMQELSKLQFQLLTPWREVRHDYITFELALEYLKSSSPRFLYIALGETDDWAHDKRYDRVLESIQYFDRCLATLWNWVQSSPRWKDSTTFVITSDHGRGSTLQDWTSHGAKVPGAESIWLAVAGPDTPAKGEAADSPPAFQRDIAPTLLDLLGVDYREYEGVEGQPLSVALAR
jgi:hypothetical protein